MPPRASLNASSRASSRKVISKGDDDAADNTFTSALDVLPLPLRRPTVLLRRRGSDGDSPRYRRHCHDKYPSMDSSSSSSSSPGGPSSSGPSEPHPLRRAASTSTTSTARTRHDTRPRLSRVLSPSTPALVTAKSPPSPDFTALPGVDNRESHRAVLAHEVSPTDTLAGVALKYGISVTELRRANQLWASDSIHLRQVLYVPLDKARHADLETVASLLAQRADSSNDDTVREAAPASRLDTNASDRHPPPPVVQRIPSTSLSFFPPPSSSRPGTPPPGTTTTQFATTSRLHSRSHSYSRATLSTPSPSNSSRNVRSTALSSFFSILPINASTRDEIMSRLSVDSTSNSTTGTASDEDEHELTAVRTTPKLRADALTASLSAVPLATGPRRKKSPGRGWGSRSGDLNGYSGDVEQIPLASSPIHTTQMQPAPTMQLPESIMARSPPKGTPPTDANNSDWRTR